MHRTSEVDGVRREIWNDSLGERRALKIFKMNDQDWVAAESLEAAKTYYRGIMGEEEDLTEARELTGEEMQTLKCGGDPDDSAAERKRQGYPKTFAQELSEDAEIGVKPPYLFASTEY